jgi:hypothetical protein
MKNILSRMVVTALAIIVAISGLGIAVAQESQDSAEVPVLAVDVPEVVHVDETVTITVTERSSGAAVEGASIYVLSWPKFSVTDVLSMVVPPGYTCEFLGKTDGVGQAVHNFDRVGRLLIVATKDGYGPGLTWLTVKPSFEGRLSIDAPGRVAVDEPVTIRVVERNSGEAVAEADVWAISLLPRLSLREIIHSIDDARAFLEELTGTSAGNETEILDGRGQHLGQTNSAGELEHSFSVIGRYLLISTKSGYIPGVRVVTVVADKALTITAVPRIANVGEDITFTARTKGTGTPVDEVALYALSRGSIGSVPLFLPQNDTDGYSLSEVVIENGEYLGMTNDSGEFTCQFEEAGIYIIVGTKDGYVPGITFISVGMFDGLRQILPQFGQFGEGLGLKDLIPRLRQFGERFQVNPWQFERGG